MAPRLAVALAAAAALVASTGVAGAAEPPSAAERLSAYLTEQLESHWWQRKELQERSGPAAAEQAADDLVELMRAEGIRRLPAMSDALVLEGDRERSIDNLTAARSSFRLAHAVDPDSPAAWWGAARTRYASGDGIGAVAQLAWSAVAAGMGDFWGRYVTLVNALQILATALLVGAALVVLVLLLREAPVLVHVVDESLPAGWHPAWREALGWTVVLAPAGLLLLGGWAIVLWAVALVAVSGTRTRRLAAACLVAFALGVPALNLSAGLATVTASPEARVVVDMEHGVFRPGNLPLLDRLEREQPREALWKYLLARSLDLRDPDKTVALLRTALEEDPAFTPARVQLGNTFFRLGKYDKAGVLYREALEWRGDDVLALFNLSRVRLATFDFDESEELMKQARDLSGRRVAELEQRTKDDDVADPELAGAGLGRRVVARRAAAAAAASAGSVGLVTVAAIVALVLGLVARRFLAAALPRRCLRCGVAICSRCTSGDADDCRACIHLVTRRAGLAPGARAEQARRVESFGRRRRRARQAAQLVWPGLALVHEGRMLAGFLLTFVWCALLLALARPAGLLPAERSVGAGVSTVVVWLLVVAVWVAAQSPVLRPSADAAQGGR